MLRIGKMTDYAFLILDVLGGHTNGPVSAQFIANQTNLPEASVSKILKTLAKADILSSSRGINGGYRLIKPVSDLSLLEVIEAMEGRMGLVECIDTDHNCAVKTRCRMKGHWQGINSILRDTLNQWSVNDLKEGRI